MNEIGTRMPYSIPDRFHEADQQRMAWLNRKLGHTTRVREPRANPRSRRQTPQSESICEPQP